MNACTRRRFLGTAATALALPAALPAPALEPIPRRGGPRLRLSLAAYSMREFFRDQQNGKPPTTPRTIDMFEFVDYCGQQGCEGAELTSYYFPKNPDADYLLRLRRHAFLAGVSVSGTAVGNTFTHPPGEKRDREIAHVKDWIEKARLLGAPHIRVFAGNLEGQTPENARRQCIEALEECGEAAARAGVFLGIENHGGIVAEAAELLSIVQAVRNPWVGINLDTGNFHSEDPYADLERCLPYAVNVQVKVEIRRRNAKTSEPTDLPRLVRLLREGGYQGWVVLEYEAKEDPFTAVPRHLAELSRLMRAAA